MCTTLKEKKQIMYISNDITMQLEILLLQEKDITYYNN